ncbi:MAG TPA: DUF2275 domain-containing protein [Candidatus Acidoferrales bacterium]|nr:DUF2275 domain-containing protein [Candidatus Acidoferrales bacterium]
MNCEEVQAQLSDYLDKTLSPANLHTIEAHLSACTLCRTETDYLSECIHQVASLPVIEPPIGFTQRVMARVREINEQPSFWQRWFFPLRIKIPLQATAVALVGILAVYILQKEPPEKSPTISSAIVTPQNQVTSTEIKQKGQEVKTDSPPTQEKTPALTSPQPRLKTGQAKTANENNGAALGRTKSPAEERNDASSQPSFAPTEAKGRGVGIVFGTPVSAGQGPNITESKGGSLRPESMTIEPFADYEMVFRLPNQAQRDSAKIDASAVMERQTPPESLDRLMELVAGSGQPQTVWLNVSKNQYEQLKRQLRAMGTVESETPFPFLRAQPGEQNDGQLQIKLTVLPPTETKRVAPSSSSDK